MFEHGFGLVWLVLYVYCIVSFVLGCLLVSHLLFVLHGFVRLRPVFSPVCVWFSCWTGRKEAFVAGTGYPLGNRQGTRGRGKGDIVVGMTHGSHGDRGPQMGGFLLIFNFRPRGKGGGC